MRMEQAEQKGEMVPMEEVQRLLGAKDIELIMRDQKIKNLEEEIKKLTNVKPIK